MQINQKFKMKVVFHEKEGAVQVNVSKFVLKIADMKDKEMNKISETNSKVPGRSEPN